MSSFLTAKYDPDSNQIYDPTVVRGVPVMAESNAVTGVVEKFIARSVEYGAILGPLTFANLPAAANYSGYLAKVSNVGGSAGSLFISDGGRWKPLNGSVRLYSSDGQSNAISGVTEVIQRQLIIPAGLLAVGDRLVCKLSQSKSGTSETETTRVRIGTAGTVADAQLAAIASMTAANVSIGWTLDMRVNTLTAMQKMGGASVGIPWGTSTSAFPATVTVPDLSTNDTYISFSSFMSSTVETTRIEDLVIELHARTS